MPLDPDAIEALSPAARVEVQDWIARRFIERHTPRRPERRRSLRRIQRKHDWPRPWDRDPIAVAERQTRARAGPLAGSPAADGSSGRRSAPKPAGDSQPTPGARLAPEGA